MDELRFWQLIQVSFIILVNTSNTRGERHKLFHIRINLGAQNILNLIDKIFP